VSDSDAGPSARAGLPAGGAAGPAARPAAEDAGFGDVPRPVILDCDPGHDDALAITLALARPELDVLGITTVGGNSPLANTTRNALRILALLGRSDVPVAAGAERPLLREPWTPVEFHGASGLDGADLPEPAAAPRPEGALALAERLVAGAGAPVTLVATAPLTNVALLLRARPRLRDRIERICLMGGSLGEGNTTASAEFNIWQDPEAAAIVFESGIPISMMGLDVTHRALFLEPDVARLAALGTRAARIWVDLLRFFAVYHRRRYGWDGSPIHDAVAVAHLAVPGLVTTRTLRVDVETQGDLTRGRTVADPERLRGLPPNVEAGVDIDRARFVDLLVEAIASYR
jgi:pyrimidine-specific ribonucleoside hydrolase